MQFLVKIVLLTSALVGGCWARNYPIPKTRALIDTLTAACYDQAVASAIRYDIIQEALDELLTIPREARDQLGTSQEGQLLLDFVIMSADAHSVGLKSDEEKEEYTRQAVNNFITFRPAYIERKLLDGEFPMPGAPRTRHLMNLIAQTGQANLPDFRSVAKEMDDIWDSLNLLRQNKDLNPNLNRVKGIWNYFNSPIAIVTGDFVLPFTQPGDVELKLYRLMRWVLKKRSNRISDGASSSSSGADVGGQIIYNSVGFPADSATKRLIDMVNEARRPTLADMNASKLEIDGWLDRQAFINRRVRQKSLPPLWMELQALLTHPTTEFLLQIVMPLRRRPMMGPKLCNLLKFLLDLENRSLPSTVGE